ncbi:MAG: hypothetical protein LBC98_04160 [Prevotellaceae bacterium]|jgi:hypothetical protein|nr:hypothetical protein [Prevotellaceae bacterium]
MLKALIVINLILAGCANSAHLQNLDKMPQAKRDSTLISIASDVVLKYGPGYYREDKEPVIIRGQDSPGARIYYSVKFLYDETQESLEWDYAAIVRIWADTGKPASVLFGNWVGRSVYEAELQNPEKIQQTPYQESILPLYDLNNPDPNQKPKNLEELQRKGYEKVDGHWIQVRPVLPAKAREVIKRKGYEERDKRWIKVRQEIPRRDKD